MKKIVNAIIIIMALAFITIPGEVNAGSKMEWDNPLELEDSVSTSIVEVEDGIVLMRYEGITSSNNTLIKYDFNGNEVWKITNDYGYRISSVSDGFIVWGESWQEGIKLTKFDKDKNIKWSKAVQLGEHVSVSSNIIEVNDGYILYSDYYSSSSHIYKLDKTGNLIKTISYSEVFEAAGVTTLDQEYADSYFINNSIDGNGIFVYSVHKKENGGYVIIRIIHFDNNLQFQQIKALELDYNRSYEYGYRQLNKVIQTDNGYIITGDQTVTLDKEVSRIKIYNKTIFDIEKIGDYLYGYAVKKDKNDAVNYHDTYIVKYDQELNEISSTPLNFKFYTRGLGTGTAYIKNRAIYKAQANYVDVIVLNTPMHAYMNAGYYTDLGSSYDGMKYNIVKYRLTENTEDNTSGGIINNIIKNPQTNSIIIIAVIILIISLISIISYTIYKKKQKSA